MKLEVQLSNLMSSIERALQEGDAPSSLEHLNTGVSNLRSLFTDHPSMALTGELFEITEQLNDCALKLASFFQDSGELQWEEQAWKSRYEALAVAHTHRRNLMSPALIDWADCNHRLGNTDKADAIYHKIVESCSEILGWGPTFDPGWMTAVGCLNLALEKSTRSYGDLEARTKELLRQSQAMAEARAAQAHQS